MLLLDDHIEELDKLFKEKGYRGYFMSNFGFPGKLQETIRKHILQCYFSNELTHFIYRPIQNGIVKKIPMSDATSQ